jgi:hypothetical protein
MIKTSKENLEGDLVKGGNVKIQDLTPTHLLKCWGIPNRLVAAYSHK